MFVGNRAAVVGDILVMIILAALFGPLLYPTDPFEMAWAVHPPGTDGFILGTDYLGRDLSPAAQRWPSA